MPCASCFHPEHTTKSIIYSQVLHYNHFFPPDPFDREAKLRKLNYTFKGLNYSLKSIMPNRFPGRTDKKTRKAEQENTSGSQ